VKRIIASETSLRYAIIALLIVATSLLYAGALMLINRATQEEGFYARGIPLSLGLFCFLLGAVSTIMLLETAYQTKKRREMTEDTIGTDWNPLVVVLVVAIAPVLLFSLLIVYLNLVAIPTILFVSASVLAVLAILFLQDGSIRTPGKIHQNSI
jgi:hypothetical protein